MTEQHAEFPDWDMGGESAAPAPRTEGGYWKPERPERLVGKLDGVVGSADYGDSAIFSTAAIFTATGRPLYVVTDMRVGVSVNLDGRIEASDAGKWFVIDFTGYAGRMRAFNVTRGVDAARAAKIVAGAGKALDVAARSGDDELPF